MNRTSVAFLSLLLALPLTGYADSRLIPAGSLIQCTISEPKISSKTTAVGDPVLCQVGHAERYGRSVLPYDSFLVGRFEDYKDPGHLVGKGWMELKFDHMVIEPETVLPVEAKVVDVPGYAVDRDGRILGKGHAVRDIVEWSLPILWPLDLVNLARRGPRPTLKQETRLTLKIMDDLRVPVTEQPQRDPSGLVRRAPASYTPPPPAQEPPPTPDDEEYVPIAYAPPPPPVYWYPAPLPFYGYMAWRPVAPPPPAYAYGYRVPRAAVAAWGPPRARVVMRNSPGYRVVMR